ncbi:diguanylate cyclase [Pseudomonas stutzeri]|nr:diguanylate cyclase [Stutzerimonas stutzeri]
MPTPRDASSSRCSQACQWLLCSLLVLAGLTLSALLARQFWLDDRRLARQQFEYLAEERFQRLRERLDARLDDLDAVRRFMESTPGIDLHAFLHFTAPLQRDNLAIAWAPRLDLSGADATARMERFAARAQVLVGSAFRLVESDPHGALRPLQPAGEHYPLLLLQSHRLRSLPLGLDLASPGPRREVLLRALDSDRAQISRRVHLVGTAAEDSQGILMLTPVRPLQRRRSDPADVAPAGVLVNGMSLRQLLEQGLSEASLALLAVELHDLTPGHASAEPIYRSGRAAASPLLWQGRLDAAGNTYRLDVRPTAALLATLPPGDQWAVLLTGSSLSLLLGSLLFVLLSQRRRAQALVERRTAELHGSREALRLAERRWALALDGIGDGVWDWDLLGDRLYFSPQWKALLGHAENEIGDSPEEWLERLHPEDLARSRQALHEHLAKRTPLYRCEQRLRRKDGSWLWLLARGKVVERQADGQPLRIIGTHVDISLRKALELELRQSHARLQGLLESATQVAIVAIDSDGRIRTFNAGAERLLGHSRADICRQPVDPLLDMPRLAASAGLAEVPADGPGLLAALLGQHQHRELDTVLLQRNREPLQVTLMLSAILDPDGRRGGFLLIALDIGERLRVRRALEERSRLLEKLGAQIPGTIFQYRLYPDGRSCFPYSSAGIREVYEVEPEQLCGDASPVFERIHPQDRERVVASIQRSAERLEHWQEDYRVLLPQRGLRWLRGESAPERLADGSVLWHGFIADISSLKQVEDELRTLTVTDPLTGIHNRRYFLEHLDAELQRRARSGRPLSLIMLDIDRFKRINDNWGHDTGDSVLRELCRRIAVRLRRIDMFCRLGGEEFIVICPETDADQALYLAEELRRLVEATPFAEVGQVTASFGVSSARDGDDHGRLLQRVDRAMYAAKQSGRNRVCGEAETVVV